MRCPAAPYCEALVAAEVLRICHEFNLPARVDRFGNIIVHLNRAPKSPPFILAAHLDHPGFFIREKLGRKKWRAIFLGGVGDAFFKPGIPVKFMPGGQTGQLGKRLRRDLRVFELLADQEPAAAPKFAVWHLQDFEHAGDRITGRACDDLIGAATILAVMANLARAGTRVNVVGVLSRAEEVGFHGALALAGSGQLPKNGLLVSLETSRELPGVQMGAGMIIRVGDRTSIFDSAGTRFLTEVASGLAKEQSDFQFQRALMSGGTCEGTAYQEFGYRSAAVCVALGNYHNCAADGTIQAEFVSATDARTMVQLLENGAAQFKNFRKITRQLPTRLRRCARDAEAALTRKAVAATWR